MNLNVKEIESRSSTPEFFNALDRDRWLWAALNISPYNLTGHTGPRLCTENNSSSIHLSPESQDQKVSEEANPSLSPIVSA